MSSQPPVPQSYRFSEIWRTFRLRSGRSHASTRDLFRGWWVTSRMEFLPDAIVHVALPLVLVLRHEPWQPQLLSLALWGLFVWLVGHWVGSSLNCLADYPVDKLDTGHKDRLTQAIDRAGVGALIVINSTEILLATVVSVVLAIHLNKPLLVVFWLVGLAVAYCYSFAPMHFKRRNGLNPLALMIIVYLTPLLFVYHLLSSAWHYADLAILLVYCIQMVSMFLADEVSDHDEDKAMGILNPCVTYGRFWASNAANGVYVLGCLLSIGLYVGGLERWTLAHGGALFVAVGAYLWVSYQFLQLARLSKAIEGADTGSRPAHVQTLKRFSKTPAWLVGTSIGAMALAVGGTFF